MKEVLKIENLKKYYGANTKFWGVIGVIVLEKVHPYIQNKLQNITKGNTNKVEHIICLSLIFILLIDITFSAMRYL